MGPLLPDQVADADGAALRDGAQSITPAQFDRLAKKVGAVSGLVGQL